MIILNTKETDMKKIIYIIAIAVAIMCPLFEGAAQVAKKPTIMIVPAADWCQRNGYTDASGNCDYGKALSNKDMLSAIASMGDLMVAENYPMLSLEQALSNAETEEVYSMLLTSKGDGMIVESETDRLSRYGGADIMLSMSLDEVKKGPNKSIEFRVTSTDAASGKILHGDVGRSRNSCASPGLLVKESMHDLMPTFYERINRHFETMSAEGREGSVVFMIADDCPLHMESVVTVNGDEGELAEYIEYWLDENCVKGAHSQPQKSRTRLAFNQMKMPLFGKGKFGNKPKALDASSFIKGLEKDLVSFGISMSTTPIGIGKVLVTLGSAD